MNAALSGNGLLAMLLTNQALANDLRSLMSNLRQHGCCFTGTARAGRRLQCKLRRHPRRAGIVKEDDTATHCQPVANPLCRFCGLIGSLISLALQNSSIPGLIGGFIFGLVVVLIDRLLKGLSLRAFSSATLGLLLGLFFAKSPLRFAGAALSNGGNTMGGPPRSLLRLWLPRDDARDPKQPGRVLSHYSLCALRSRDDPA